MSKLSDAMEAAIKRGHNLKSLEKKETHERFECTNCKKQLLWNKVIVYGSANDKFKCKGTVSDRFDTKKKKKVKT